MKKIIETLTQVPTIHPHQFKWAVHGEEEYGKGNKITWARYMTEREANELKLKRPDLLKNL